MSIWKVVDRKTLSEGVEVTLFDDGVLEIDAGYYPIQLDAEETKRIAKWLNKKVLGK